MTNKYPNPCLSAGRPMSNVQKEKIKIRLAREKEWPEVVALTKAAFAVAFKPGLVVTNVNDLLEIIKTKVQKGHKILVAEKNHQLVGAVRLGRYNAKTICLYYLAVLPECRNQGIAARLINQVCKIASEQGDQRIILEAIQEKGLPSYYEKLGFVKINQQERSGLTVYLMEKKLMIGDFN